MTVRTNAVQKPNKFGKYIIRLARREDLSELLPLIEAYYRFDSIRFDRNTVAGALRRLLRDRSLGRVWIIEDGAKSIGYAVLTFNFDLEFGGLEGMVTDLFISAGYRRRGLGERALAEVGRYCRSIGIRTIELQVEEHNRNARKFYRRIGFRRLPRVVMSRDLA